LGRLLRDSWRLLAARRAGGHPDVRAAETAGSCRSEDERSPAVRQRWLNVVGGATQGSSEVFRGRPRLVHAATRGSPEVGRAEAASAIGVEIDLASISAERWMRIGDRRTQVAALCDQERRTARITIGCRR